jgi:hypothetical protein
MNDQGKISTGIAFFVSKQFLILVAMTLVCISACSEKKAAKDSNITPLPVPYIDCGQACIR